MTPSVENFERAYVQKTFPSYLLDFEDLSQATGSQLMCVVSSSALCIAPTRRAVMLSGTSKDEIPNSSLSIELSNICITSSNQCLASHAFPSPPMSRIHGIVYCLILSLAAGDPNSKARCSLLFLS
jgi:hypothetical protein